MAHPRDERIAELKAEIEAAKAEIAQLKADEQTEIAEDKKAMNLKAAAENKKTAINLQGNRDAEGNLIPDGQAMNISGVDVVGVDDDEQERLTIRDVTDEQPRNISGVDVEDDTTKTADANYPLSEEGMKLIVEDKRKRRHNISGVELPLEEEEEKASIRDVTDKRPMNIPQIDVGESDVEEDVEEDVDTSRVEEGRTADESEKDTDGRRKATEIENLRGEKPGWEIAEGSNFWSVNEKDPYWKTEEGYEEAVNLYGDKPSWLKAKDVGTLVYNPSTGEYEEVEQEEFVDLSPKKRPSL